MALLTLVADLKPFIHMGEAHDDVLLQSILDGTIAEVEQRIGQVLETVVVTEFHDGDRTNTILLDNGCITALTHIKIDGTTVYDVANTVDYEWYVVGEIVRKVGYFSRGFKNIEVKYTHGYTALTIPADLKLALLKIMSNTYHGSLVVMEVEGEAKIYSQKEIDAVIGKYVRLPI